LGGGLIYGNNHIGDMSNKPLIFGQNSKPVGITPSVILCNPKYSANVGAVQRAASCFGAKQVWWTGNRVRVGEGERLPREERLKGYKDVELRQFDYPFEHFGKGVTPVAIELLPNSECLMEFEHPENAVYVFGPEDGSIPQVMRQHCHRFVKIPTRHCTNLAAAVYLVLYDRAFKRYMMSNEKPELQEDRGHVGFADEQDYTNGMAFV
jgi:tRNA(Leu) C34 or U34 (ribose-2'-O)-methylase TrmL